MNCPYCGSPMKPAGPMIEHCEGKKGAKHERLQFCGLDRSYQTHSDEIADWFSDKGYQVDKPGEMYDIR